MITRRSLLAATMLLACAGPGLAQTAKPSVVATFSIVGDIVQNIGGDRIQLSTLVKPGVDAHVYTPTPADAKLVGEARLIFANGLKFESWMGRLRQSTASKATFVEVARDVKERAEKGSHSHGHGHSHGGADPHAWQDVANVKIYAANVRDGLIAIDPEGKATYEANATRYLAELDALDRDIKAAVAKIPAERRKVITSHDAFGYFEAAYGLQFIAPRGVSTESEPSAKDVARLIQQIKREKIAAVFLENISDQRQIQQIAKDTGARVGGTLYSDALSVAGGAAPTYIQMMRHNIRVISEALTPAS